MTPAPLTEQDEIDIRADLAMEERSLERIDDSVPLAHMVDEYQRRRAACVAEIERLREMLRG